MMTRLRASRFGEASATDERVQAIVNFGFTERQARFLTLVMRHAGVCVPRQFARFAGVSYGAKCNAFLTTAGTVMTNDPPAGFKVA